MQLVYVPQQGALRLAWSLVLRTPDGRHWWQIAIDAVTGEELSRADWIARESYRVYPLPTASPDDGPRTLESMPADPLASPFGWHDTNGVAGAEFTDTRGNNVSAQEDVDFDDLGGFRPEGGAGLDFDFAIDLAAAPSSYQSASITNLFYMTNIAHDLFYQYGFDEASGNFQSNNYLRGGLAGDAVQADAQDGGDTNNAQFGTPPDGAQPRMEMYLFTGLGARVDVTAPASIVGLKLSASAQFGPVLDITGVSGSLVQALDPADGTGPSTTDACTALTNSGAIAGTIALIDRGSCNFTVKVKNAQNAGAIAAVVANDVGDDTVTMSGSDPSIVISSLFIGQSDGDDIKAELGTGVSVTLRALVDRDAALDNAGVLHEYAHGVTNRLTGGAATVFCLQADQSRSMGEGWSDFFQLAFTGEVGDAGTDPKFVGAYSLGEPNGPGFRSRPYTTDFAANELTLADTASQAVPHGVGEVWAAALWDAYWELVQAYGYDPDLYLGQGGNNLAIQLVMDGLKLQACSPTFLEARDAVFDADLNETGGDNACYLWRAFAKRGMGPTATISADPAQFTGISEDFSLPAACSEFCGDGIPQIGEECDDGNRIEFDGCAASCEIEFQQLFMGTAAGGSVTLIVEGVLLVVPTTAGQSAAQVAAVIAAAINADPTLMGMGIVASGVGDVLVTTGSLDSVVINDPGLAPSVPLGPAVVPLLGLGLLGVGLWSLRARGGRV
jgi:cysteine-rich repeat protein